MSNKHSQELDNSVVNCKPKLNWFERACLKICPCFGRKKQKPYLSDSSRLKMNTSYLQTAQLQQVPKISIYNQPVKPPSVILHKSAIQTAPPKDSTKEYLKGRRTIPAHLLTCPILNYRQKVVHLLGDAPTSKMLCKVTHIRLAPPKHILAKLRQSIQESRGLFSNPKRERFWARRYLFFEKFDQGVRLDEGSWVEVLPEAIAEHIAVRAECATVIDGYCGVGNAAIKFAATCKTVYAVDVNNQRLECLGDNARIYSADNIVKLNGDFLNLKSARADTVFLHLPLPPTHSQSTELDPCTCFFPPLKPLLQKSLFTAPNLILLLPPNLNIPKFCSIFSQVLKQTKTSLCSVEFQKIYFLGELKYIAVYYGPMVNRQLKLSDELDEVYRLLNEEKGKVFHHVRVVKEVRERYGMGRLLGMVCEAREQFTGEAIDMLYEIIKERKMIPPGKLSLLMAQQKQESGKTLYPGRPSTQSQHTKSFTSGGSLFLDHQLGEREALRETRVTDGLYRFDD